MPAIKITDNYFSGLANVQKSDVVQGLAQDHARIKLDSAGVTDLTDNSGGTNANAVALMTVPTAAFDAQTAGGSPASAFDTAAGKIENACAVFADHLNNARVRLGLVLMTWTTGTIATAGTLASLTTSLTATSGATAIDFTTGVARMKSIRNNIGTLARGLNEVLKAVGDPRIADASGGTPDFSGLAMEAVANATAGTGTPAGATSISDAVMDAFLLAAAANIASLADWFNDAMFQTGLSDLTDNSAGVATDTIAAAAKITLVAYQDVATASVPKVQLDTELAKIDNNFADLSLRTNLLLARADLSELTDNSGGTANTTLEIIDDTLTAVDGTGSNSTPFAGTQAIVNAITNNISSLVAKINLLAPLYGVVIITDSAAGTVSNTLAATAVTGAGVDNGAAATGLNNVLFNAYMVAVQDALASMAGKLNEMTGTGSPTKPLRVVAAL